MVAGAVGSAHSPKSKNDDFRIKSAPLSLRAAESHSDDRIATHSTQVEAQILASGADADLCMAYLDDVDRLDLWPRYADRMGVTA